MNITLPPATEFARKAKEAEQKKKLSMELVVERFINSEVLSSIEQSNYQIVNVQVPFAAYENLDLFYSICEQVLAPLGYKSRADHEGGGMYNTLSVRW